MITDKAYVILDAQQLLKYSAYREQKCLEPQEYFVSAQSLRSISESVSFEDAVSDRLDMSESSCILSSGGNVDSSTQVVG